MPMVFITSGTSFVVPADCNKFDWIDCIGEGGGCGNSISLPGGAGGAWSRVNNLTVTPGSTVFTFQPMSDINVSVKIGVLATFEYKYPTGALPDYDPAVILVT